MRGLSPALVPVALVLAGPQPGAAPEYGEWAEPVRLPGPINSVGTFGAVVSRDGLTLFCTRGGSLRRQARLGRQEEALDALERAYESRSHLMAVVGLDSLFEPLRPTARFQALLRKAGAWPVGPSGP